MALLVVWDEKKREANIDAHGFDFSTAERLFDWNRAVIWPAHPGRRGEPRFRAIGLFDSERLVTIVFSPLGKEAISIISMRAASAKERRIYAEEKGV
jgi:uncharacterized DUF497 family protein